MKRLYLASMLLAVLPLGAQNLVDPDQMPGDLQDVRFEQRLGEALPLGAVFTTEEGREVKLGDLFGERPVVLSFVYYECPMLCSLTLNGLAATLSVLELEPGRDFDVVVVSFDPGEVPSMARDAEARTLDRYGRSETAPGWHFLTGGEEAIVRLTEAVGFEYTYLPESDEYAHTSGIVLATPAGQIAKYFYGMEYPPKDVRLALVEASANEIGTIVDQLLLYCFRFNPELGQYTIAVMRILRLTGGLFVAGLLLSLWILYRRERNLSAASQDGASPEAVSPGAA